MHKSQLSWHSLKFIYEISLSFMKELNLSCTHTSKSMNLCETCNISRFTMSLTFTIHNYHLLFCKSLNRLNRTAVASERTPLSFCQNTKTFPHGRTWTKKFLQNFEEELKNSHQKGRWNICFLAKTSLSQCSKIRGLKFEKRK